LNPEQLALAKRIIQKEFAGKTILYQESLSDKGIRKWVNLVVHDYRNAGMRPSLQLDYDLYAAGEAELAWLDEEILIYDPGKNAGTAAILLINKIYAAILLRKYPVGHLKFLINAGGVQRKISFTSLAFPAVKEESGDVKTDRLNLLINARVQTDPVLLSAIVNDSISGVAISTGCKIIRGMNSAFRPGYPKPSHRLQHF
jgi:hypothetical protein